MLQQKTKKHTSKSVFYAVMLYKTMYKVTKFNKDLLQFASKEFIFSLFDLWNDHFAFLNAFYTSTRLVRKAFNSLTLDDTNVHQTTLLQTYFNLQST